MMKLFPYFIIIAFFMSCSRFNYVKNDFQGTYLRKTNANEHLIFNSSAFANINRYKNGVVTFSCCDTITYGTWGIDNEHGMIYLNSPKDLILSMVHLLVNEATTASDSLVFVIDNPIEEEVKKGKIENSQVVYRLAITDSAGLIIYSSDTKKSKTNIIKLKRPAGLIDKISIIIFPDPGYRGRNLPTQEVDSFDYTVKDANSNRFRINIPELNYGFITYLRL